MLNQSSQNDVPATLFLALLGAAGDLAWRLVVPALYDLYRAGGLPARFDAANLRDRKMDLLSALRPIPAASVDEQAARGQYGAGWTHGQQKPGYRQEAGVNPDSNIETYAAIKLPVDNWRRQDVPFYLRTGKSMAEAVSKVSIRFRPVPHQAWPAGAERLINRDGRGWLTPTLPTQ